MYLDQGPPMGHSKCDYIHMTDGSFNPLPDENILDWSKLTEIADDILKCIESER